MSYEPKMSKVCRLKPRYFLGASAVVDSNAHFVDDNVILYSIGRSLIYHDLSTNLQRFMKLPDSEQIVTKIEISPNRQLLAVVEKGNKPTISVFNIETRNRVVILGIPSSFNCVENFQFVSFTSDNERIVGITGPSERLMIYYNVDGRIESVAPAMGETPPSSTINITQMACNPSDPSIICIVGYGLFRFISWTDGQWIQYGFNAANKLEISGVCWTTDEIVIAGTKCGRLLVIEYGEVRGIYHANSTTEIRVEKGREHRLDFKSPNIPKGYKNGVYHVKSLTSFIAGFAYSYCPGKVVVFEKIEPLVWLKRHVLSTIDLPRAVSSANEYDKVRHIAVSPSSIKMACLTDWKEINVVDILEDTTDGQIGNFNKIMSGFHLYRVPTIAICRWKPFLMSIGKDDGFCRIWNYKTKKLVLDQLFANEKMYSCAFHPTGWYCLLGFKHQLKYFLVTVDVLKSLRLFRIRMCNLCRFSRHGHIFAASDSTRRTVEVYCCTSFDNLWSFKCYNNPATSMYFGRNDNYLFVVDPDGSINVWDLQTGDDTNAKIYLDSSNHDVAAIKNGSVYFVGMDGDLKEIVDDQLRSYKLTGKPLYSLAIGESEECLFVGSDNGSVIAVQFPLTESFVWQEFKMHSRPIRQLLITCDDSTLITLDDHGIVGFWRIKFPLRRQPIDNIPDISEVVVNVKKLAEEDETIIKQSLAVDRKFYQHNFLIQHLKNVKEKDLDNLTNDYLFQIEELKRNMKIEEKLHSTTTSKFQRKFEELTGSYVAELEKQSRDFEAALMVEYSKSDSLRGRIVVFNDDVRHFIRTSKMATKQIFDLYDAFADSKVKEIKNELTELRFKKKTLLQKFERKTYFFDKFINDVVDSYKEYHDRRLVKLSKRKEYLKDEISYLIRKSAMLDEKTDNFYSSGMKLFGRLDEIRVDGRILKTKVKALQLTLGAVDNQLKKKEDLIFNVKKMLKSDFNEQMEKNERLDVVKLVVQPLIENELKRNRDDEEKLRRELIAKKAQILSVGLCIAAVERRNKNLLRQNVRGSSLEFWRAKKFLDDARTDLNRANKTADNRHELNKSLVWLYRKYVNPKENWETIKRKCDVDDDGNPLSTKGREKSQSRRLSESERTGLEDVVELNMIDRIFRNGEEALRSDVMTMKASLPRRPRLVVGIKQKGVTTNRMMNVVRDINNYRYRIAEAMEILAREETQEPCTCPE